MLQLSHVNRTAIASGALARQNYVVAVTPTPFAKIWIVAIEGFSLANTGVGVGYLQLHATDGAVEWEPDAGAVPQFQLQVPEGQTFAYRPPMARRMLPRAPGGSDPSALVWAISSDPNTYVAQAAGRMVVEVEYVIEPVLPYAPSP